MAGLAAPMTTIICHMTDFAVFAFHAAIIVACRIAAPFVSAWYWLRGER
jgi:hypothetical protein